MFLNQHLVYLVQTETTAGFLSQDATLLASSKKREANQPFIVCVSSLKKLREFTRVAQKYKNHIRRSCKSTYIYPNKKALRVVKEQSHLEFLEKLQWCYSSSANLTKKSFDASYAKQKADIIVEDERGFFESAPSKIYKISRSCIRRIR